MAQYVSLAQIRARVPDLGSEHDAMLTELVGQASAIVDTVTRRSDGFGMTTATRTFDGSGTNKQIVGDIVAVTLLRIRQGTTGTWTTVTTTDVRLRPSRPADQPARWIEVVDGSTPGIFTEGYDTVEVTGIWGWPAVPKAIEAATAEIAIQTWRSRNSGIDQLGIDPLQQPGQARALPALAYRLLQGYTKLVIA